MLGASALTDRTLSLHCSLSHRSSSVPPPEAHGIQRSLFSRNLLLRRLCEDQQEQQLLHQTPGLTPPMCMGVPSGLAAAYGLWGQAKTEGVIPLCFRVSSKGFTQATDPDPPQWEGKQEIPYLGDREACYAFYSSQKQCAQRKQKLTSLALMHLHQQIYFIGYH